MSPGSKNSTPAAEQRRLAGRKNRLLLRARMTQAIRSFFEGKGYLEVQTPKLIPAPAPETHIDAVPAGDGYLQTSPELFMKRMLASGYERIFQISTCFRKGERGRFHLPEFTMLEWYRMGIGYMELMEECEDLILWVSHRMGTGDILRFQGTGIHISKPWERLSVRDAFLRFSTQSPEDALAVGCFDEIMVRDLEPHFGKGRPTFLYDYPAPLAALAQRKPNDPRVAERFEVYMGGVELANGFTELTDAGEQRARFHTERQKREEMGKPVYPCPHRFLTMLEHLSPCAGIALGVDRLAMIFSDAGEIDDVVPFTPEEA
jgi:lysyl-tRNA synthetase class 2